MSRIPFLIELARRTRVVIAQNIVGSIILALFGLALAATGKLVAIGEAGILLATLFYLVPPILVFGNSFRLVRFGELIENAVADNFIVVFNRLLYQGGRSAMTVQLSEYFDIHNLHCTHAFVGQHLA